MTRVLLLTAAFGLAAASAGACEFQRSVENKVDPTVVASVSAADEAVISTAVEGQPTEIVTEEPSE